MKANYCKLKYNVIEWKSNKNYRALTFSNIEPILAVTNRTRVDDSHAMTTSWRICSRNGLVSQIIDCFSSSSGNNLKSVCVHIRFLSNRGDQRRQKTTKIGTSSEYKWNERQYLIALQTNNVRWPERRLRRTCSWPQS